MDVARISRSATPRTLAVRFPYDPDALAVIRDIPGRKWDKVRRVWTVPDAPEHLARLREAFDRLGWRTEVDADVAAEARAVAQGMERAKAAVARGDGELVHAWVTEPYAHQRAGLDFLVHGRGGALLWEMGLGKTKTAIDFCEWLARTASPFDHDTIRARLVNDPVPHAEFELPALKVLVVCPNTVKRTWQAEVVKHAGHASLVVPEGTLAQRANQYGRAMYTIVNVEQLSFDVTAKAAQAIEWDVVIADESTRFKDPRAKRTKALHKLSAHHRVILTGTPVQKPEDVWSQFEFVSPGTFGSSFYAFRDRYLDLDYFKQVTGIKPHMARELRERIEARSYRVLKSQVLDLPPKVYGDREVTLSREQQWAYKQMKDELRVELEDRPDLTANNILTLLLRLTQITAGLVGDNVNGYLWLDESRNAKLAEMDALLLEELRHEQVVVFGQYQTELRQLAARYPEAVAGWPAAVIFGPTPEKDRARYIDEFQAGQRRLLFAQSRTGGIGITLTAAQTAIYYTRGWSLEEYLQSQDRLHRIGQTGTVSILHLVAKGTIDEDIAAALAAKQDIADHLTGDAARKLATSIVGR